MLACQGMSADHDRKVFAVSEQANSLQPSIGPSHAGGHSRPTFVRYRVLMLTFIVAFVMYMDRTCVGVAAPTLMQEFGLNKIQMGWAAAAFNAAYTLFQVPAGWMADRYGPRAILGVAIAWWSVFTAATGLSSGFLSFTITRFLFGVGEAAAFPAASRYSAMVTRRAPSLRPRLPACGFAAWRCPSHLRLSSSS
jgi:MFS family permease